MSAIAGPGLWAWRPMAAADIPAVLAIAAQAHPDFPEEACVFAERQRLHPGGAWLLLLDGLPAGYFIGHPWFAGDAPALDSLLGGLPEKSGTFYFHDLALLPAARGTGAAAALVAAMLHHAASLGLDNASLVAVNGSLPFWSRHGFVADDRPVLRAKLRPYGSAARLMVRPLA